MLGDMHAPPHLSPAIRGIASPRPHADRLRIPPSRSDLRPAPPPDLDFSFLFSFFHVKEMAEVVQKKKKKEMAEVGRRVETRTQVERRRVIRCRLWRHRRRQYGARVPCSAGVTDRNRRPGRGQPTRICRAALPSVLV